MNSQKLFDKLRGHRKIYEDGSCVVFQVFEENDLEGISPRLHNTINYRKAYDILEYPAFEIGCIVLQSKKYKSSEFYFSSELKNRIFCCFTRRIICIETLQHIYPEAVKAILEIPDCFLNKFLTI